MLCVFDYLSGLPRVPAPGFRLRWRAYLDLALRLAILGFVVIWLIGR